jgi:hypothetical protein
MGRIPTRNHLAVSPYELGCAVPTPEELSRRGRVNYHHSYFYRRDYEGHETWKHIFRNVASNIHPLLVEEHNDLHADYGPPKMPPNSVMIEYLDMEIEQQGQLVIARRKDIANPRIILPEQWQNIRNGVI